MRLSALLVIGLLCASGLAQIKKTVPQASILLNKNMVAPGKSLKGVVKIIIPEGYHINANPASNDFLIATSFSPVAQKGLTVSNITYPSAKTFKVAGEDTLVYEGTVYIHFIVKVDKSVKATDKPLNLLLSGKLRYQACDDNSCYPPGALDIKASVPVVKNDKKAKEINTDIFKPKPPDEGKDKPKADNGSAENSALPLSAQGKNIPTSDNKLASMVQQYYQSGNWFILLLTLIIAGLLLNLTPCVYPIIAITVGFFSNQAGGSRKQSLFLGLIYMAGIVVAYSALGGIAALLGKTFGFQFQSVWVSALISAVMLLLALSMFDVYEFRVPNFLAAKIGGRSGVGGAAVMGLLAGVAAAPCAGPVVLALMAIVSQLSDIMLGFLLFFALGFGLGLPYLALSALPGLLGKLPRSGDWMTGIKHILGLIIIGVGVFYLRPLLSTEIYNWVWFLFLIACGVYLIIFEKTGKNTLFISQSKNILGIAVILFAGLSFNAGRAPAIKTAWTPYNETDFILALKSGKPTILDFTADWCQVCHELESQTFSDSAVASKMSEFNLIQVDATRSNDPLVIEIQKRYTVLGLPTVIIFDNHGNEISRLTSFEKPNEFLQRLSSAILK